MKNEEQVFKKFIAMSESNASNIKTYFEDTTFDSADELVNFCCMTVEFTANFLCEIVPQYGAIFQDERLETIMPELIFSAVSQSRLERSEKEIVH